MAQETLKITITADNKQAVQNIQETVAATTQMGTWRCRTFAIELPPIGARIQLGACVPRSGLRSWLLHIRRGRPSVSNQHSATTVH